MHRKLGEVRQVVFFRYVNRDAQAYRLHTDIATLARNEVKTVKSSEN